MRQLVRTFLAFEHKPKTMMQVSLETGIERANVCRYMAYLKKHHMVELSHVGKCPITGFKAGFYKMGGVQ